MLLLDDLTSSGSVLIAAVKGISCVCGCVLLCWRSLSRVFSLLSAPFILFLFLYHFFIRV